MTTQNMENTEQLEAIQKDPVRKAVSKTPVGVMQALMVYLLPRVLGHKALLSAEKLAPFVTDILVLIGASGSGKSSSFVSFGRMMHEEYGKKIRLVYLNAAATLADTFLTVPTTNVAGNIAGTVAYLQSKGVDVEVIDTFIKEAHKERSHGSRTPQVEAMYDDDPDIITIVVVDEILDVQDDMAQVLRALFSNRQVDGDRISDNVIFVGTANPPTESTSAREQAVPFLNRMTLIHVRSDHEAWMNEMFHTNNGRGRFIAEDYDGPIPTPLAFFRGFMSFVSKKNWATADARCLTEAIYRCTQYWLVVEPDRTVPSPKVIGMFADKTSPTLGGELNQYTQHGDDDRYQVVVADEYFEGDEALKKKFLDRMDFWLKEHLMLYLSATGYDLKQYVRRNIKNMRSKDLPAFVDMLARLNHQPDIQVDILKKEFMGSALQAPIFELLRKPEYKNLYETLKEAQAKHAREG